MQEKAFSHIGRKVFYVALELREAACRRVFREIRQSCLSGFNVTVPYKENISSSLDKLTPEAKSVGAVNTVYRKGRSWIGTNTDVYGFVRSLEKDARFSLKEKNVLVLGAGGAARAVVFGCVSQQGGLVTVLNRHKDRAKKLASFFRRMKKCRIEGDGLDETHFKDAVEKCDIVINATSVGLNVSDPHIIPAKWMPEAHKSGKRLFYDLIYRPAETVFLRSARLKGHRTLNGAGMLVYQGARAFELWTGQPAPESVMRKELMDQLKAEAKR